MQKFDLSHSSDHVKKSRLHIIFWIVYFTYDTFLQLSYWRLFLDGISGQDQLWMAIRSALIVLPLKMMVTYAALYFFQKSVVEEKKRFIIPLTFLILVIVLAAIMYRAAHYYYIDPFIYHGRGVRTTLFGFMDIWKAFFEILSVACIAIIIKFVRAQFQSMEKERLLMKEKLESELEFLRNQTNPHFLFNTLNNIYALALKKSDDTPAVVKKLTKLLNFMIYESGKERISIGDEMQILEDYIELERIRYANRLELNITLEIDNEKEELTPLLLLPFVENAFKHGVSESQLDSYIHIDIRLRSGILQFEIENTKEQWEKSPANGNIGLVNARRQIELLYTDYNLDVMDKKELFKVNLMINLNSHAKI